MGYTCGLDEGRGEAGYFFTPWEEIACSLSDALRDIGQASVYELETAYSIEHAVIEEEDEGIRR